ncbi:FAD synthetase family protein [Halalkalibacterium ligniniphilum]|uniref:FAD synthetase family protein n=1 Tax=Halalkalibacterium ligniniphilum TaxID=1134413 RepID=UPI0003460326|nr:FAD synthetase family protein [Halalkalibacterium ligniniphilum]
MYVHPAETLSLNASMLAIGTFDGVHLGHQTVIRQMVERSQRLGVPSIIYTFDPPPRVYFENARQLLSLEEKLERIFALGVEHIVIAHFDEHYLNRSVSSFITEISALRPEEIFVGTDFRFGKKRSGGIVDLQRCFQVRVIEKVCCERGEVISSTRIRQMMSNGEELAAQPLLNW